MNLSIVIPTLDRHQNVKNCIESIENCILPFEKEVIVVDQSRECFTKDVCDEKEVIYINSHKKGLSLARNIGIRKSTKENILFLDDDIRLPKDYFLKLKDILETRNFDILTGRLIVEEKNIGYSHHQPPNKDINIDVNSFDILLSSGTLIKRSTIDAVGYFDERFGLGTYYGGSEEADYILRSIRLGKGIFYSSNLISYHPEEVSNLKDISYRFKRGLSYGRGRGALLAKHRDIENFNWIFLRNYSFPILGFFQRLLRLKFALSVESLASFIGRIIGYLHFRKYEI